VPTPALRKRGSKTVTEKTVALGRSILTLTGGLGDAKRAEVQDAFNSCQLEPTDSSRHGLPLAQLPMSTQDFNLRCRW
jgi:hypothetical protein